jgi:hypothetical protein
MPSDTPQRYASPEDVERHAARWPKRFLECRLYGHEWRPKRATHYPELRYVLTVQRCPRCTSERFSELSERGAVLATWIEYAEGYLTEHVGRIVGEGRDVLRVAALERVFNMETSHDAETPRSKSTREALGLEMGNLRRIA